MEMEEVVDDLAFTARGPGRQLITNSRKEARIVRRMALLFAAGAVWLFLFALPVLADNGPHVKGSFGLTPSACASCHRAHSAAAPDITVQAQPGLCYTCHGAGATGAQTDVQDGAFFASGSAHAAGATAGSFDGALRGGGFEYALINTSTYTGSRTTWNIPLLDAGAATTSSHSVDGSPVEMWGNGPISNSPSAGKADVELTCGSCHDPHGNGRYRILKPAPNDSGIAQNSRDPAWSAGGRVYINDAASKIYTTTNYGQPGDANSALNSDGSALWYSPTTKNWYGSYTETASRWCQTCHTRYLAPTDGAIENSGDAVFAFRHAVRNIVDPENSGYTTVSVANPVSGDGPATIDVINPLTAGSGVTGTSLNSSGVTTGSGHIDKLTFSAPMCITCHVSHGSNAAMASSITSQSSPGFGQVAAPNLDSTLLRVDNRGVCQSCHSK